jgi:PAS domain S-box-containing protein
MSFRLKIISGVILIETLFLIILVWNSLIFLQTAYWETADKQISTIKTLLIPLLQKAILAQDREQLKNIADSILQLDEVIYVHVKKQTQTLFVGGMQSILNGATLEQKIPLNLNGQPIGHLELGFMPPPVSQKQIQRRLIGLAILQVAVVAIWLFFLTTALRNRLLRLKTVYQAQLLTLPEASITDEIEQIDLTFNVLTKQWQQKNDILEEKIAQTRQQLNQLYEGRVCLEIIIDRLPSGIILTDAQGQINAFNPEAARIFDCSTPALLGQHISLLFPQLLPNEALANTYLKERLLQKEEYVYEATGRQQSGIEFPAELAINTLRLGEEFLWVVLVRDISERKQVEQALQLAKSRADLASRAKSQFLATMSHEIRTPLNAVLGMTTLLLETRLDDEQRSYALTARESGTALMAIINDILDFSKIEAGKLELETTDFNLSTVMEGVADLLASKAHAKKVDIATCIDKQVPDVLQGDQGRLRQILLNLAGNAVKFTKEGGVLVQVALQAHLPEKVKLYFTVKDTGIGIKKTAQTKLFREFNQAHVCNKYGGTGLGLSISRRLVEMMQGNIGLNSEYGQGSTFWFTAVFKTIETTQTIIAWPKALHLLIVDENEISRQALVCQLDALNITAVAKAQGHLGLATYYQAEQQAQRFDIVLISQTLSDMTPEDLSLKLKKVNHDVKLILLKRLGKGTEKALPHVQAILTKPIKRVTLKKYILNVLGDEGDSPLEREVCQENICQPQSAMLSYVRILLADDSPASQAVTKAMLKKSGYHHVDTVNNGLEAVEAVMTTTYDVVLMDMVMPEMDGLEATQQIRQLPGIESHIPIIALTANAIKSEQARCFQVGMNDYLTKPIEKQNLLATIARWTNRTQTPPLSTTQINNLSDPLLDENLLQEFIHEAPAQVIQPIVDVAIKEIKGHKEAIILAVEQQDFAQLRREAHGLKGNAATFGLYRLEQVAKAIEAACHEQQWQQALAFTQTLPTLVDQSIDKLFDAMPSLENI